MSKRNEFDTSKNYGMTHAYGQREETHDMHILSLSDCSYVCMYLYLSAYVSICLSVCLPRSLAIFLSLFLSLSFCSCFTPKFTFFLNTRNRNLYVISFSPSTYVLRIGLKYSFSEKPNFLPCLLPHMISLN